MKLIAILFLVLVCLISGIEGYTQTNVKKTNSVLIDIDDLGYRDIGIKGAVGIKTPDSENHIDAWLGKTNTGRDYVLDEVYLFELRNNSWKYIQPKNNASISCWISNKYVDKGFSTQLQRLETDAGETTNLSEEFPQVVIKMEVEPITIFKKPRL
ncbi:MAG: hypothetical protein COA80_09215 [Leeuwenhoekiella sp.]|nr:MAG: hypothetical protein COA80_09215 [Leeuwenhoekiella sp.]